MPRYLFLSVLALVSPACDRGLFVSDSAVVRDSAGVRIVENRSTDAPVWPVDAIPVVDIGRAEGEGADVFGTIRQVIKLHTGELAVADASDRTIRVFDEGGRHKLTFGGQGEGPGEFVTLGWIAPFQGDSIAAMDNLGGRVSLFAADGAFGRSYSIPRIAGGSAPNVQGILPSGDLVFSTRSIGTSPTARQSTVLGYAVDPQGNVSDRFGEYPDRELGSNGLGLGFGGAALFAVGGSVVWYAHSSQFNLSAVGPQGSMVRSVRLDRLPRAVTDAEVAEAQAVVRESLRRQGASGPAVQRILETEFAKVHPVMGRILVDDSGSLWVARYTNSLASDQPAISDGEVWDVFDPDGRLKGVVIMPSGFRVDEITDELLIGVHTDAMGVERVHVHRVHRQ